MHRTLLLSLSVLITMASSSKAADVIVLEQLLRTRKCPRCRLTDADLVHADLRDADLSNALLQRANLSQVNLDGANLRNADLSFTTVRGASLRGADLRGSRLFGTDLSNANLSGAQLDPKALEQSHWQGAHGISRGLRSHASLHNAGVEAAQANRWQRLNACSPKQSRPNQQNRWAGLPAESCDASGSGGSGSTGSNKSANDQIMQPSNITLTSDGRQNYNR